MLDDHARSGIMGFIGNVFTAVVSEGAKLLDSYDPRWFERINTETLNMESVDSCILGQLFNSYLYGVETLGIDWAPDLGFDFRNADANPENWALLEIAWIDAINERISLTY